MTTIVKKKKDGIKEIGKSKCEP